MTTKPIIGISACLLGEKVRFDGGHKRSTFCLFELAPHVDFKSICPEMGIGLGTPRPTMRLQGTVDNIRAVIPTRNHQDVTEPLRQFADQTLPHLHDISGYIFCAKSPSCGAFNVKLYHDSGQGCEKKGMGIYAQRLMQKMPLLPVEEDGRLNDRPLRENFLQRVYAYQQWQQLQQQDFSVKALLQFHARYKLILMAHSPQNYQRLGQIAANSHHDLADASQQYIQLFMQTLTQLAQRKGHVNVLQHLQGYYKKYLNALQRKELTLLINKYRLGIVPLWAPLTLLNHYQTIYPNSYVQQQAYLAPYPEELKLRHGF